MAFSLRKMLSNMNYFKKNGEPDSSSPIDDILANKPHNTYSSPNSTTNNGNFERTEADSTSKPCANSVNLPDSIKKFAANKGSLSDTDIVNMSVDTRHLKTERRKCRNLKLDIKKASKSASNIMDGCDDKDISNHENTPKHILLDCPRSDVFSERFKRLDFDKSFELFDTMSDDIQHSKNDETNFDIESMSDQTDTDISTSDTEDHKIIKMCRKVDSSDMKEHQIIPSTSLESLRDEEIEKNEEERFKLLHNYQIKMEQVDFFLKKMLSELKYHIKVSKVFQFRSITALNANVINVTKQLKEITHKDSVSNCSSPTNSWNIVIEKEDNKSKFMIRKQLQLLKTTVDDFISSYLKCDNKNKMESNTKKKSKGSLTYPSQHGKKLRINSKKKIRHFDFPDIRDAMVNLFSTDMENEDLYYENDLNLYELDDMNTHNGCGCHCHYHRSPSIQSDSESTTKNEGSISNQSIGSSIGNFSLNNSTLTAYSESLDKIISYNSFQDSNSYITFLQKSTIERITFYVQVHSIQLKCYQLDEGELMKNSINFHCPSCKTTENDEDGLLKHILSFNHCEKIHFTYKTAYIKKCVASGKEIQPSTVLNPMTMYRDDNKIVCFGDAMYACSLCFENLIIGESVLMAHCSEQEHVERRERLPEILN